MFRWQAEERKRCTADSCSDRRRNGCIAERPRSAPGSPPCPQALPVLKRFFCGLAATPKIQQLQKLFGPLCNTKYSQVGNERLSVRPHSHSHSLSPSLSLSLTHSLSHTHSLSFTHSCLSHTLTPSRPLILSHTRTGLAGRTRRLGPLRTPSAHPTRKVARLTRKRSSRKVARLTRKRRSRGLET